MPEVQEGCCDIRAELDAQGPVFGQAQSPFVQAEDVVGGPGELAQQSIIVYPMGCLLQRGVLSRFFLANRAVRALAYPLFAILYSLPAATRLVG